jgi:GH25 family lysozyme M1 (1,4-beta-N-acetylmuramidase)
MEDNLNNVTSPDESDPVLDAPVSLDDLDDDMDEAVEEDAAEASGEPADDTVGSDVPDEEPLADNTGDETVKTVSEKEPGELYIYDNIDDEPVDDRDLYRDFTAEMPRVKPAPPTRKSVSAATEKKSSHIEITDVSAAPELISKAREIHGGRAEHESKQPVRVNRIYVVNTVISMFTLCAVAAGIFTGYAYMKKLENELGINGRRISGQEETSSAVSGEEGEEKYVDAVSLIDEEERNEPEVPESEETVDIEKGKLLLYDSYVGYSWVPIISGVKPHSYIKENFHVDNDNRMEYVVNGDVSSYFGIDVSSYQGDIDWDAVRSDGVEFAILRIGVRGYGEEGNIKLDEKFFQNYDGARKAGLDLGVYFYSQAVTVDEAVGEAKFVLEQLGDRKLEYPIVFDWEPVDATNLEEEPRTADIMPGTLTLCAVAFCETIRDAGYEAMIYTNKKMAYIKYDMRKFADYPVWLALYSTDLTYYYDFDMWQYGFGRIDGIEGDVDLDIAMIR